MTDAYAAIYTALLPRLAACDLEDCARRMGFSPPVNGILHARFLGRDYQISHAGIEAAGNPPVNVNNKSVLIHYLLSDGKGDLCGVFVPLFQMTGMAVQSRKSHEADFMGKTLLRHFGHDLEKLDAAAAKISGIAEPASKHGERFWHFPVLPKIPLRLRFDAADADFPADMVVLLDQSAALFLPFECLAFLAGCVVFELIAAAKTL